MKKYFPSIFIFFLLFLIFSYKLISSFNFHPDFARDIYDILTIIQGKLTLIGPKLSFGGIYSGPYYYYLFVPIFYLTKLNIYSLLFFNCALFLFALIFFHINISKKYGVMSAVLGTLVIGLLPMYLISSRSPWNGSTYLPFLLIFLIHLYFYDFKSNKLPLFLLGLIAGMIASIHLVNLPIVAFSAVYLAYFMKKRINIIYFLIGTIVAFSPLILFEVKHNFIMLKNTFFVKSYRAFVENKNIPNAVPGKKNVFENLFFICGELSKQIGFNVALLIGLFIVLWKKFKEIKDRFFIVSSFALILFVSMILRYQFDAHYLFPIVIFIVFTATVVLLNIKYRWLLIIILLLEIYSFPKDIYSRSVRKPEKYEKVVRGVIDQKLIQKGEAFNVIQISKDYAIYVPIGHEYRFFFRKYGFIPQSEFAYRDSRTLLIFSEIASFDVTKMDTWEGAEFGKKYLQNNERYQIDDVILYRIKKNLNGKI